MTGTEVVVAAKVDIVELELASEIFHNSFAYNFGGEEPDSAFFTRAKF